MTSGSRSAMTGPAGPGIPRVIRLLQDEAGVTTIEYAVAALALVLAAIAASRAITGVLVPYLHRIYLIVALPIP